MIDPLIVEFDVRATPAHAFDVWTRRCQLWWPRSHTVSGEPGRSRSNHGPGGGCSSARSAAKSTTGARSSTGHPPTRVRYLWHLFFDPSEATEVELTFTPAGEGTRVRLEQRGWDRLGHAGPLRRTRTGQVWSQLTATYREAVEQVS